MEVNESRNNNRMCMFYPRGQMELVVDRFFPCTIRVSKKIFPIVNKYATDEDKGKLRDYLTAYIADKEKAIADLVCKAEMDIKDGTEYRHLRSEMSKENTLKKRAKRNLETLDGRSS